jgi:hypothetical protein
MLNQSLLFIHAASDAKLSVIDSLRTNCQLIAMQQEGISFQVVNVDSPEFVLDDATIATWKAQRTLVLLAITPQLLLNAKITGAGMRALLAARHKSDLRVLPIYCKVVPRPENTIWAELSWFPNNSHDDYRILSSLGGVDSGACRAAETVARSLEDMARQLSATVAAPEPAPVQAVANPPSALSPEPWVRSVEDCKIPPLAVLVAPADRAKVAAAMRPMLEALQRINNVRAYLPWALNAGADLERRRLLGEQAQTVVVMLSPEALADASTYQQIAQLKPTQKVIMFELCSSPWQMLGLKHISAEHLPKKGKNSVPLHAISPQSKAWQQLAERLMQAFPEKMPSEDAEVLTEEEQSLTAVFAALEERRRPRPSAPPLSRYDDARAYYEK